VMLMLAYVTGAIVGGILVAARKKTMKGTLPFGTFLCFSAVTVMFWGQQFLEWYFSNFYY
ncbi:MAG: prepilin peptidase, partial [Candidatus Doudnabacteria bacterium]|nr:prepilin peptidase [Candidatus Doudnabacteria bacterium]